VYICLSLSLSIYIYIYIYIYQNCQYLECTLPWPNRIRLLKILI